MQRYEAIEDGIEKKDIKALREAIGSIIYTSRNFSSGEFDEAVKYVESKGIKLKDDALIGKPTISSQKNQFTEEDFVRAIFELKKNFCDERIQDVKHISKTLYSSKAQSQPDLTASRAISKDAGKLPNQQSHQKKDNTLIIVGLVAVIVIVIVILLVVK